jgi:hypothetical protein
VRSTGFRLIRIETSHWLKMRISEKTIELTFAAQCASFMSAPPIWFGLTQQQEARLGFDACTRMNGGLVLFQFKASSNGTNRLRRYTASHDQLQHLQLLSRNFPSVSIYYVFPRIEDSTELASNPDLLSQCHLVDIGTLPDPFPPPTNIDGSMRKNFSHNVELNLATGVIRFHSEPVDAETFVAASYLKEMLRRIEPVSDNDKANIFAMVGAFSGASIGLLTPISQ